MSMPHDANNAASAARALPQIRLLRKDGRALVAPPVSGALSMASAFEPFPLPKIPLSKLSWAGTFCEIAWQRHRRCVGIVLLVNTRTHRWGFGFPARRCSKTAACWSVSRADFPQLGDAVFLGGSFQCRLLASGEEPEDAVPPADGLHIVMVVKGEDREVWGFVRAEDQVRHIPPEDVAIDDWAATFEECRDRLRWM